MKSLIYALSAPIVFFLGLTAEASLSCHVLFAEPFNPYSVASESNRVEITKISEDTDKNSQLILQEEGFSPDSKKAVIELVRMLVQNSDFKLEDKNVLTKNKFTLGVPLKNGYSLLLNYESKSGQVSRFVLQDKILLMTPTGKEIKITDEILGADALEIKKSEFDLNTFSQKGLQINLKIPLTVDGDLLKKFSEMANYFEYFSKEELRELFNKTDNLSKIKTYLNLRKAKTVFFDVLIKQPFKTLVGGAMMFFVFNSHVMLPAFPHTVQPVNPPAISQMYIQKTIDNLHLPADDKELRQQFAEIRTQAESHALHFLDSKKSNLFIFEQVKKNESVKHTYLVFSEDLSSQLKNTNNLGMQYFVMEINAAKNQKLISFIKNNDSVPTEKLNHQDIQE